MYIHEITGSNVDQDLHSFRYLVMDVSILSEIALCKWIFFKKKSSKNASIISWFFAKLFKSGIFISVLDEFGKKICSRKHIWSILTVGWLDTIPSDFQ